MKWYEKIIGLIERYEELFKDVNWDGMILKETEENKLTDWCSILKECIENNKPLNKEQEKEFLKLWEHIIY
jgi:hypothetical protein